ncbi:hypothetical protein PPYR_00012 [Photinus pyralis]|uniref:USP domain-containing protein n=1 Tax=Photinus pyralis TaxID=7054 RepID=A0A5N4B0C3_PHOPY|nr:hypothetical protein PPYR_00012 [Photinus pyralis]
MNSERARGCAVSNDRDNRIEVLKNCARELIQNGQLVSSNADVFKRLSVCFNISPKAVYLYLKNHVSEVFGDSFQIIKQKRLCEDNDERDGLILEDDEEINEGENLAEYVSGNALYFEIKINYLFRSELRPMKHRRKIRLVKSLAIGWSDDLFEVLWNELRLDGKQLPCNWSFKRGWITDDDAIFFKGGCTDCLSSIVGETRDNQNLIVKVTNFKENVTHDSYRILKGIRRKEVADKLKHRSSFSLRAEMANQLIKNTNDPRPPHLPNLQTLRKLKSAASTSEGDVIATLIEWKNKEYRQIIFDIGISPFYIFYSIPLQREWYASESKKRGITISIDATGSLVVPPKNSEVSETTGKLRHIFLYSIMAKTNGKSVPIQQMISQQHNHEFIAFWLQKCFRNLKPPCEVVCDQSDALLLAMVKSFTTCKSMKEYVKKCISALQYGSHPPELYIRYDRSHFVKNIIRKVNDKDLRKRDFFRSVIGVLIKCDDFSVAATIIRDLFTTILNKYDGLDASDNELPAERSKKRLLSLCSTHNMDEYKYNEQIEGDGIENDFAGINTGFELDWIQAIIETVNIWESINHENIHDNLFYSPNDKQMYIQILSTIVLWSNVMNTCFNSRTTTATSSDVESSFNILKNHITEKKMVRVDNFLRLHINFITSELKLHSVNSEPFSRKQQNVGVVNNCLILDDAPHKLSAEHIASDLINPLESANSSDGPEYEIMLEQNNDQPDISVYYSPIASNENEAVDIIEETWRNKNPGSSVLPIASRRSKRSILNPTIPLCKKVMLLKNGFVQRGRSQTLQTFNTCAFDSIFHVYYALFVDYEHVRNAIDKLKGESLFAEMLSDTVNKIPTKKLVSNLYIKRNKLLVLMNKNRLISFDNGFSSLDCNSNITFTIEHVLHKGLYSYMRQKVCSKCTHQYSSHRIFLDINQQLLMSMGLARLNDLLNIELNTEETNSKCPCGDAMHVSDTTFSNIVLIDLQCFGNSMKASIKDIPDNLSLLEETFVLSACIQYIGEEDDNDKKSVGHYICHVKRINNVWETYDDLKLNILNAEISKPKLICVVVFIKEL